MHDKLERTAPFQPDGPCQTQRHTLPDGKAVIGPESYPEAADIARRALQNFSGVRQFATQVHLDFKSASQAPFGRMMHSHTTPAFFIRAITEKKDQGCLRAVLGGDARFPP